MDKVIIKCNCANRSFGALKLTEQTKSCCERNRCEVVDKTTYDALTNLCYYDKRNPNCTADDDDITDHLEMLKRNNSKCPCDNCFYGRTPLAESIIIGKAYAESKAAEAKEALKVAFDGIITGNIESANDDRFKLIQKAVNNL